MMGEREDGMSENLTPDGLNHLFVRYRTVCGNPEGGPEFVPGLWRRIESRRGISAKLRVYARNLVTAAATACALMVVLQFAPALDRSGDEALSYVDALGRDAETEVVAYASFGASDANELSGSGR